ncbi:MAG TPA: hypothetical protein VHM23_22350 [Actinomycetota bacterium]|nr:hypothetical protein [Actinomycetota bacterium]
MASDVQRPDNPGVTTVQPEGSGGPPGWSPGASAPPDAPAGDVPPGESAAPPRARAGAYWTGLVVLAAGLAITVATLATRVTSIAQTVLLAIPLALTGIGLERVGRGTGRGSLRAVGALLLVVAVVGPLALSLSSPNPAVIATASQPVPAGASRAELRADLGGGQLRIDPEAPGLYAAELRGPGRPSTQVTTADDLAVLDLRAPAQRGMLARNRGNDWRIQLNTSLAWRVDVSAGAVTADLNLTQLDLRGVTVQAGVSRLAVRLGDPAAEVPVDLQLSTGFVDLYLPRSATVEVRVEGLSIDNLGDQGLTRDGGVWRAEGIGSGRYLVRIRTSGARLRVHRG